MSVTSLSDPSLLDLLEPQRDDPGNRASTASPSPGEPSAVVSRRRHVKKSCPERNKTGATAAVAVPPATDVRTPAYLSVLQVARRFSVSVPTIWRWAKTRPEFPKPVLLSPGTTRWRVSDLIAFEQSLGVGA
jgi:predicted DNA-binding transcriptional regulator AlpA